MRYRKWFLLGMFLVVVLARAISSVHAQTITSFDAPDSTGTFPQSINPRGEITGYYNDSGGVGHGFVRDQRGTFTSFDVIPFGINPAGEITGSDGAGHGFVRDQRGTITSFDPPGSIGTSPVSINPRGEITGWYIDSGGLFHGFVRSR